MGGPATQPHERYERCRQGVNPRPSACWRRPAHYWDATSDLYRELTILLATTSRDLNLHDKGKDFVDRCIRLLKKARFVGEAQA